MTRMIALILLAAWAAAVPASAATVKLGPGSALWLEGDSTLHPYSSTAAVVDLALILEPGGLEAGAPAKMTVSIPVDSLKSGHKGLDKNLRKALKAEEHPKIVFTLKGYKLSGATITAWGDLSLAGKARAETLTAAVSSKDGKTVIDGAQPLLMSDFGIKPPKMMLGTIKTHDRVVVKYHLELEQEGR